MYLRLKDPWAFRGWKLTPYALRAEHGPLSLEKPLFMPKEAFLNLLGCNGEEQIDLDAFDEKSALFIRKLIDEGIVEESEEPLAPLEPWQRYRVFPARYMRSAHWSITGKCNFSCRHCLVSAPDAHLPQLPLADMLQIVHEIAACGINLVDITGGEPLLRDDLEQIVEALAEHGIKLGTVFTNASLLTDEVLDMFEAHDQHPFFQLSFDGLGHHDWLRGIPGAEAQADAALKLLQRRGFLVSVGMCIHRGNKESLRATANYLAELGVRHLRVNAPQELGVWTQYSEEYALSEDEVWETYQAYIPQYFADGAPISIELDGFFRCAQNSTNYAISYLHRPGENPDWERLPYCESCRYSMHIGPNGRVYPCMGFSDSALKEAFPSIFEQALGDITLSGFYHGVVETKIADLLEQNPECARCEHLHECCGGCMVQDISAEGDYLVPDSRACWFFKHVGEEGVRAVADAAIKEFGARIESQENTQDTAWERVCS